MSIIDIFSLIGRMRRIVGWGAGGLFHYYHTLYPLPLDFLIDSDPSLWGSHCRGLNIRPPKRLADEDPKHTLIIIYSSFSDEIAKQIEDYGPYTTIFAPVFFSTESVYLNKMLEEQEPTPLTKRSPVSRNCLLVQGPVYPKLTESVLRFYARHFSRDFIILSTWAAPNGP